ncbi:YraN family protein [bacterium]|nr:YraN family protein [bacterium]
MNNITTGKQGEKLAVEYLTKQGYKIIETNRRFSRYCEIDIIAKDKDTYIFCEVKTRRTMICGSPLEAITKSKYQNIKKGIFLYIQENPNCKKYRIDAISILLEPKLDINHLKNI